MQTNQAPRGCIDFYGYASTAGGWLVYGWIPGMVSPGICDPESVVLCFEHGQIESDAFVVPTARADVQGYGHGVAVHVPGSDLLLGQLVSMEIIRNGASAVAYATPDMDCIDDEVLIKAVRGKLDAEPDARMQRILARETYQGRDTLDNFTDQFRFQIDEPILCGSGLLIIGWVITAPEGVRALRVRSGRRSTLLDLDRSVRVARADVVSKWGQFYDRTDLNQGFIVYLTDCVVTGSPLYVEIEMMTGDVGFKRITLSRLLGLDAIRRVLTLPALRYNELTRFFDTLGTALSLLNRDRLRNRPQHQEIQFGQALAAPRCSVIVPVYGRIDYMEIQVALLSSTQFRLGHELIYVIDDPSVADAVCHLADGLFRRFGLPMRLILLDRNMGFGPASNIGLSLARGTHVCFLNSDVFAAQPEWLDVLLERLVATPSVGILAPLLTFEDGTVQHQGLDYERMPRYGNWFFPTHPGKGSLPDEDDGLTLHPGVTGACMVMTRALAADLGGFDEGYVIGDFEDSDLCLRVRLRGLTCAVDRSVSLYHLERKSQGLGETGWRLNVTLYNAWLHQRRWVEILSESHAGAAPAMAGPAHSMIGLQRQKDPLADARH